MHDAGWLHRDVSPRNVIAHQISDDDRPQYRGKIIDYEYCKRIEDRCVHDVRTGTPHTMAGEVDTECWLFLDRRHIPFFHVPLHGSCAISCNGD